ncbi:major facilitator superfamily domain-containing protein [Collybia nuda]|uniref:Major facilitator superfamily domain-containing protein n=1 Tax=Collybia nuda TaxID=64659 RepID=A0A9P5Y7I7_9AGAR|nr:major facilitator superfamily domain-containing protein [Collybia nuda]
MSPRSDMKDSPELHEEISPRGLKLDHVGLPLLPQPTTSPFDPLNYPNWLKYALLLQVSFLAFLATFNVAIINPAVVPLAAEFGIPPVIGTYQTSVAIGTAALGPLLFTPFANVYGRRPAYLLSILIGFVSAMGSALAKTYETMIVVRAINGFGPGAALALGVGTVVDVFYMHQRGRAMGFFTLTSTAGGKLSPIVGGFVARELGWRWCFWVGAILNGILFFVCLFLMPETIFDRPHDQLDEELISNEANLGNDLKSGQELVRGEPYVSPPLSLATYLNRLWIVDLQRPPSRRLKATDFVIKPLSMLKYPSVTLPALFFAVSYGYASIEPALTLATLFTEIYHFSTVQNGLANGVTLLLGTSLGELCSGPVTDAMMQRARKKAIQQGTQAPAEIRLQVIWIGAITVPVGLLMYVSTFF